MGASLQRALLTTCLNFRAAANVYADATECARMLPATQFVAAGTLMAAVMSGRTAGVVPPLSTPPLGSDLRRLASTCGPLSITYLCKVRAPPPIHVAAHRD